MKTVTLEIEDSKFEQFMTMIELLKSDVVKRFQVQKLENDPFEPSLKLHKLQGSLEKFHAVRLTLYKYCEIHNQSKGG